jgi:uncharacterized protein YfbU (UPF0304 family)
MPIRSPTPVARLPEPIAPRIPENLSQATLQLFDTIIGLHSERGDMKLTNEQKLLAVMLAEIHKQLQIRDGMNSDLVLEAIYTDNQWAIGWGNNFLFPDAETPSHVSHVVNTLDMWAFLEEGYAKLDEADRARLAAEADPFGKDVKFRGFDGNNEIELMSAARMLVDRLDRFQSFKGRADTNSHSATRASDGRMLAVFEPIRVRLGEQRRSLNVDEMILILKAQTWPGHSNGPLDASQTGADYDPYGQS